MNTQKLEESDLNHLDILKSEVQINEQNSDDESGKIEYIDPQREKQIKESFHIQYQTNNLTNKLDFLYKDIQTTNYLCNSQMRMHTQFDKLDKFKIEHHQQLQQHNLALNINLSFTQNSEEQNQNKIYQLIEPDEKDEKNQNQNQNENQEVYLDNSDLEEEKYLIEYNKEQLNQDSSQNLMDPSQIQQQQKIIKKQNNNDNNQNDEITIQNYDEDEKQRVNIFSMGRKNIKKNQNLYTSFSESYFSERQIAQAVQDQNIRSIQFKNQEYYQPIVDNQEDYGEVVQIKRTQEFIVAALNKSIKGKIIGSICQYQLKTKFELFDVLLENLEQISCFDISKDETIIIIGFHSGEVIAYSFTTGQKIQKFKCHKGDVLQILIITDLEPKEYLSYDITGQFFRNYVNKGSIYNKYISNSDIIEVFNQQQAEQYLKMKQKITDITLISKNLTQKYFGKRFKLLGVAYKNYVDIFLILQNSCKLIFQCKKPKFIQTQLNPCISWGDGQFRLKNSPEVLFLSSFGKYMFLTRLQVYEDELAFHKQAYFIMPKDILYAAFIDSSIILVILADNINQINLVHTHYFEFGFPENQEQLDQLEQLSQQGDYSLGKQKGYFKSEKSNYYEQNICQIYNQFQPIKGIFTHTQQQFIYLNNQNFLIAEFMQWKDYLIEDTLKCNWITTMQKSLAIYQGKVKFLGGIKADIKERNDEMQHFICKKLSFTFLTFSIKIGDKKINQTGIEEQLKILFEFAFKTQTEIYLFQDLRLILEEYKLTKYFYNVLEHFISLQMVPFIPEIALNEICENFASQNKKKLIEKLLLQINLKDNDFTSIIQLCINHQLYSALIYITTKKGDFITPIIKMFGKYIFDKKQNIDLGLRCLWYLKTSFQKQFITGQMMNHNEVIKMIQQLSNFVFNLDNLVQLFEISVKIMLDIIFIIYLPEYTELIAENYKIFNSILPNQLKDKDLYFELEPNKDNEKYEFIFQILNCVNESQKIYLEKQVKLQKEQENKDKNNQDINQDFIKKQYNLFKIFYMRVLSTGSLNIKHQTQLQIFIEFLQINNVFDYFYGVEDEKQLQKDIADYKNKLVQKEFYSENNQLDKDPDHLLNSYISSKQKYYLQTVSESEDIKQSKRNAFVIMIIKQFIHNLNEQQIQRLQKYLTKNKLIEAECFVLSYKGELLKCFDKFLEYDNPRLRKKIFAWIENIFLNRNKITDKVFDQITDKIIENFKILIKTDQDKALKLVRKYFKNQNVVMEQKIIDQLQMFPQDLIIFLSDLIKYSDKVSDKRKIEYIELLCKNEPKEVYHEISNNTYPIDQVLKLTQKYNIKRAYAYTLSRAGNIKDSLQCYREMFLKYLQKHLKKISQKTNSLNQAKIFLPKQISGLKEKNQEEEKYKQKLLNKLQDLSNICQKMYDLDGKYQKIFYETIDTLADRLEIIQIGKKKKKDSDDNLLSESIKQEQDKLKTMLFSKFIIYSTQYIEIQDIIKHIVEKKLGEAPLCLFSPAIQILQDSYLFITGTCYAAKEGQEQLTFQTEQDIRNKSIQGFSEINICNHCKKFIVHKQTQPENENQIILLRCGHIYHLKCVQHKNKNIIKCNICKHDQIKQMYKIIKKKQLFQDLLKQNNGNNLEAYIGQTQIDYQQKQKNIKLNQKQKIQSPTKKQNHINDKYNEKVKKQSIQNTMKSYDILSQNKQYSRYQKNVKL